MNNLKARLIALVIIAVSGFLGYHNWQQLIGEGRCDRINANAVERDAELYERESTRKRTAKRTHADSSSLSNGKSA